MGSTWEVCINFIANITQRVTNLRVLSLSTHVSEETAGRGRNLHIHLAGFNLNDGLPFFDSAPLGHQPFRNAYRIVVNILPKHNYWGQITHDSLCPMQLQ